MIDLNDDLKSFEEINKVVHSCLKCEVFIEK